jgi:hypothetical protein
MFFANAAKDWGRSPINESAYPLASDFEKLFGELADGPTRAELGQRLMDATHPQAEIMVGGQIETKYIQGILVRSHLDAAKVRLSTDSTSGVPLSVDRSLYDMRAFSSAFAKPAGPPANNRPL